MIKQMNKIENEAKMFVAFADTTRIAYGTLSDVAVAAKRSRDRSEGAAILVFNEATGEVTDLDLRGSEADVTARYGTAPDHASKRGRPKLGVIAREVTLLPRHWEWLAAQKGGASVALRRLVEEARRADESEQSHKRAAQELTYKFMATLAGDLPGFEEATRALFAGDAQRFQEQVASWPDDVRVYAIKLAFAVPEPRPAYQRGEIKS